MRADPPARPSRARPRPGRRSQWHARLHDFRPTKPVCVNSVFSGASLLTDNWHIDVVSGCHQTFRAPEAVTGVGAMPAPPADGGGMGADVPNPGEWESWAREAETLWAAVSARKPRLEFVSGSGRAGPRESARGGRDADGVPETHAAWPAAQLFTPGTIVTPAERADVGIFAASTAPPASRGPTASVPGWRTNEKPGDEAFCGNTDVSAFDSVSRAAAAADLRRRRESRPAAAARRAWRDVERAYLRTVRGDGPLAGTPLALRGADAARIALTREKKNQKRLTEMAGSEICPAIVHDQSPGSIDLLNDLLNALPFPNDIVSRAFRLWRVRCRSINRARSFAKQRRFKRLRLSLRAWRDDAFRERTRKVALKAIAFETWLGRVLTRRAVDAATASAAARATRRGATGAWRVWRARRRRRRRKKRVGGFF